MTRLTNDTIINGRKVSSWADVFEPVIIDGATYIMIEDAEATNHKCEVAYEARAVKLNDEYDNELEEYPLYILRWTNVEDVESVEDACDWDNPDEVERYFA